LCSLVGSSRILLLFFVCSFVFNGLLIGGFFLDKSFFFGGSGFFIGGFFLVKSFFFGSSFFFFNSF
jgi:hypothetical protein